MVRFAVLLALVACEPMPNPPGDLMAPVLDASPEPQLTQATRSRSPLPSCLISMLMSLKKRMMAGQR